MCVFFFKSRAGILPGGATPGADTATGADWCTLAAMGSAMCGAHLWFHLTGATGCLGIATWVECGVMPEMGAATLSWRLGIPGLCSQH